MIGFEKIISDFPRFEKTIYSYVKDRIDAYYDHRCYTVLKNRCKRLDNSIDLRIGSDKNQWNSKIAIPYGHESYLMTRATITQSFNADPLISLEPIGETDWVNAQNAQDLVNQNLKSTRFRDTAFKLIIKRAARYGSCPVISSFEHRPATFKKTVNGQFGYEQQMVSETRQNVINRAIHPLNYFQNPDVADYEEVDYQGWIDRITVAKLMGTAKTMPDLYIKKNLEVVIKEAIDSVKQSEHYHNEDGKERDDFNAHYVDVTKLYTMLNFEGNEEDETLYYIEVVGDKIIRIQDNPNDYNITGISIFNLDKRSEYWWGNTPIEKTFPMENYANILLSMTADNIFKSTQNLIFYPKGMVDIASINDRHKNGGFIPIEPDVLQNYKNPFMPWQRQEISTNAVSYMMGEMKEALQRTQAKPDIQRTGVAGGPKNDTATAYQGMQADAGMLQYDYLSEFASGVKSVGRSTLIMMQQRSNDRLRLRPNPKEPARIIEKHQILGDFAYQAESALSKNTQFELMKYQNALTWVMNMVGTGNPAFQRVNVDKIFRATLKKFDFDVDTDEIYPEQPAGMEAPQQGQLPAPAAQVNVPIQLQGAV